MANEGFLRALERLGVAVIGYQSRVAAVNEALGIVEELLRAWGVDKAARISTDDGLVVSWEHVVDKMRLVMRGQGQAWTIAELGEEYREHVYCWLPELIGELIVKYPPQDGAVPLDELRQLLGGGHASSGTKAESGDHD